MTIRIYGKVLNKWMAEDINGRMRITQREIEYREYDSETGEITAIGSEDFSPKREAEELAEKWIWTWDGKKLNRGGHRWFECHGSIRYRKSERASVKQYLEGKYTAEALQLR